MPSFIKKLSAIAFGKEGEKKASRYLKKNGYEIIEKNFRCRGGEIDIIARQGNTLIFCEVKARRNKLYGTALEAVTPSKREKIKTTAKIYMQKNNLKNIDCRFDVVTIDVEDGKELINLIQNAF